MLQLKGVLPAVVSAKYENIAELTGEINAITYIFLQMDRRLVGRVANFYGRVIDRTQNAKGLWYLDKVHLRIGDCGLFLTVDNFPKKFYLDDRVRESLSLLAYLTESGDSQRKIKFRKTRNLRSIKDPLKIRVIEASRKVTRQDMSLLTLALNPANRPKAIRKFWENTLAVTKGHLALSQLTSRQQHYFFSPHAPCLTENNYGFFYSPETVEDLPNAYQWGGKNDILLSSYLHFRNMPETLPDWLLRTAMVRSVFEQKSIKKFEQESFLSMILECSDDAKTFPPGLFRAKWKIRKVFGEDIFPGTLLLIRFGYMEITPNGEIILSAKGRA